MKLGRNELCHCGSSKKYKKCCIDKDRKMKTKVSQEEKELFTNFLFQMKDFISESKEHIKKYHKIRKIHGEVLNSMISYYENGKYDFNRQLNNATNSIMKELNCDFLKFKFGFDSNKENDIRVLYDLIFYKNHKDIISITEEYLNKNKFRSKEKVKMLSAMKNSFVGLFKIVDTDLIDSYVELEDVFTKRKFKIVDMSLSLGGSTSGFYIYNRIITYEDISFGSGLNIAFNKNDKKIIEYIRNYNVESSNLVRTLDLYELCKKSGVSVMVNNIK